MFLFEVYVSTRQLELAQTGWDEAIKAGFLRMQFRAMRNGYAHQYPKAEFSVILLRDRPVGRIVVDRSETEIRLVDIALLTRERGQGIGTCLVKDLQTEAARAKKPIHLQVLKQGGPRCWYERLGFVYVHTDGVYESMVWRSVSL